MYYLLLHDLTYQRKVKCFQERAFYEKKDKYVLSKVVKNSSYYWVLVISRNSLANVMSAKFLNKYFLYIMYNDDVKISVTKITVMASIVNLSIFLFLTVNDCLTCNMDYSVKPEQLNYDSVGPKLKINIT